VFGLDDTIAGLGQGGGLLVALAVALLLGLRHATDPDHLTAVSTLVMSDERRGSRQASALGLAWGLGHACTLFALGLPMVVFGRWLPAWLERGFELAIGAVIVALAVRLLLRWRRGYFHVHVHSHDGAPHVHPHMHERGRGEPHPHAHEHRHLHQLGRSPLAAFGIGLVHGAGGSAGVGVLLIAAMPGTAERVAALVVLALGTALSMAAVSAAFGHALGRGPLLRRFALVAPVFGAAGLAFGVWYVLGALSAVPYAF
jgi:ABC-type nickel/cobalt efflux system permease component RcnA